MLNCLLAVRLFHENCIFMVSKNIHELVERGLMDSVPIKTGIVIM